MKKKKYKVKPTKKQMKIIKEAWKQLQKDFDLFLSYVRATENWMEEETGIEGIEFFMCDNDYVGVGTATRSMKLIKMEELEGRGNCG